jgi:DNA-binding LacI/PurR family transcriptional regulator
MDRLVASVESAGGQAGYDILVFCNYNRSPKEIYQFLNGGLADGLLLFAPRADDPLLPLLRKCHLPVAIVNGRDPEGMYPSVADDMAQGMRLVAQELVSHGHRRIGAFLTEGPEVRDASTRLGLLRRNLFEHGIEILPRHTILVGEDAREAVSELMALPDRPTAVFCWHDRLAYRVLAACEDLGVSVPTELSVVGYDGIQWPATTSHIATSAKVDLHALARESIRTLDRYIEGYDGPLLEEVLPVSFVRGTSLGPALDSQWSNLT